VDSELLYVKKRFEVFFDRVNELSAASRPPGRNAANGWFRQAMNTDATILAAGGEAEQPLTGDALTLHAIYVALAQGLRGSFVHGNYGASWATHSTIVGEKLDGMSKQVFAVVGSIFMLMSGDEESDETQNQEKQNFLTALGNLMTVVFKDDFVGSGAHANGWISVSAKNSALGVLSMLNQAFSESVSDDGDRIAAVIRSACVQVAGLQTQGHNPWLRADWQIKFQGICGAAAITLRSLK
jgi:hypothetical protein